MRVSTAEFTSQAIASIDSQSSALQQSQNEVATGLAVPNAAANPVAATQILQLVQQQAQLTQYGTNLQSAQTRLTLEQTSLSTVSNTVQSIRDLVVQAGDASLNNANRQQIVTQIQSLYQSLLASANTKDSNGEYLFSGYATLTQPFASNAGGTVSYQGNDGNRLLQISANQSVADSDAGSGVFMNIPAGNGTFVTAANSANTGGGSIDSGSVVDIAQWKSAQAALPGPYTLSFSTTGTTTTYTVTDSSGATVPGGTGTYTSGAAIQFDGVQVTVSGTPAAGDSFTIAPAGTQSVFAAVNQAMTAISQPAGTPASNAQLTTSLGTALTQIDQIISHLSTVSASVGARISMLNTQSTTNTSTATTLATQQSNLQDANYASAVSTLNEQYVGLQAAEQSYAAIAQLSLFKYLP